MALVIGIVIGVLIGAGLVYLVMSGTISKKNQELDQTKRALEDMERTRESRLRAATEALRSDFQRKLNQQKTDAGESTTQPQTTIQSNKQTTIQSNKQTTIQSDQSEPKQSSDSSPESNKQAPPQPQPEAAAESSESSSSPESEPEAAAESSPPPETEHKEAPISSSELPDQKVPRPPARGTMAPMTDSTQPEISFVRSGLTDAQQQELVRVVLNMGQSRQVSHLPELQRLSLFSSVEVRKAVAIAIGDIASAHSNIPAIRQAVPLLGRLSQDPQVPVRFAAAESLGSIQSSRVLPYVRRLLRDPDMTVVSAAKTVMDRFKYYPSTPSSSKQSQKKSYGSKSSNA